MIDVYVLDTDLKPVALIDDYTSLIWAKRYVEEGDCELYIEATEENLEVLKKGNYLMRTDDDMICLIEKIEIETNVEDGNFMIITGYDVKKILRKRIIWNITSVDGNVEDFIRQIVRENLVSPNQSSRYIKNGSGRVNFFLGDKANFTEVSTEQVSYKNVAEKVQELCTKYGWGYKIIVDIGNFYFILYKGKDKSDSVIFSPDFENIISTHYSDDISNYYNVALIGGEGEGSERARNVSGYAEGLDRNEIFVDARDISRKITYSELLELYPNGSIYPQGATTFGHWRMDYINIPKVDDEQFREVKERYPDGYQLTIDGNIYWQTYDVNIAVLEREDVSKDFEVTLLDVIYNTYLINRGYEKLAEYPQVIAFDGTIDPETTFKYKQDYDLGDVVSIKNEFGIECTVRIVEIIENWSENGYSIEPRFEYVQQPQAQPRVFLLAENGAKLRTESGAPIELENSNSQVMRTMSLSSGQGSEPIVETGVKISELPESTDVYEGYCLPIVTYGETKKVTYALLKTKIETDLGIEPISNNTIDEICV